MFSKDDLVNYNGFSMIIKEGMYDIEGSAVIKAALLFDWYNKLGPKIKKDIDYQEAKASADLVMVNNGTVKKKKGKK